MDRRLPLALAAALVSVLVPLAAEHRGGTAIAVPIAPSTGTSSGEVGRPFLTCFGSREYGATAQNWVFAEDTRGSIARIASLLAEDELNIATLRLTRQKKGGDAFMVIELDDYPDERVRDHIRALPWVRWAFRLDKVSA